MLSIRLPSARFAHQNSKISGRKEIATFSSVSQMVGFWYTVPNSTPASSNRVTRLESCAMALVLYDLSLLSTK